MNSEWNENASRTREWTEVAGDEAVQGQHRAVPQERRHDRRERARAGERAPAGGQDPVFVDRPQGGEEAAQAPRVGRREACDLGLEPLR
jgi:hypothetical protein